MIKIGAKVTGHGPYVTFQMAEVALSRQMFADIQSLTARLRAPPECVRVRKNARQVRERDLPLPNTPESAILALESPGIRECRLDPLSSKPRRSKMIERIEWEMVSRRRMFSLLGVAVALGLAVRPTDAEAQTPNAGAQTPNAGAQTPEAGAATPGMERRHKRRQGRVQRRYERRGGKPASTQPAASAPAASQPPASQPPASAPPAGQPPQKQ
jgi:hypothetical protein